MYGGGGGAPIGPSMIYHDYSSRNDFKVRNRGLDEGNLPEYLKRLTSQERQILEDIITISKKAKPKTLIERILSVMMRSA